MGSNDVSGGNKIVKRIYDSAREHGPGELLWGKYKSAQFRSKDFLIMRSNKLKSSKMKCLHKQKKLGVLQRRIMQNIDEEKSDEISRDGFSTQQIQQN